MTTIQAVIGQIRAELNSVAGDREARQFAWWLFDHLRGYSQTDLLMNSEEILTPTEEVFIAQALGRLKQGEPIQYVLGQTEFLGLPFKVDARVLIPRPETEELVEWILAETVKNDPAILDIGTGSGCIPIALKHHLKMARVEAWDVSPAALDLARENARLNGSEVDFKHVDVLNPGTVDLAAFDIVVSNPPYVTVREQSDMAINVLNFEPHLALFVGNHEPLLFYSAIARLGKTVLKPGGYLYFEINQAYGTEVVETLEAECYAQVELRKDLSGRDRMVRAVWPGHP